MTNKVVLLMLAAVALALGGCVTRPVPENMGGVTSPAPAHVAYGRGSSSGLDYQQVLSDPGPF